MSEKVAHAQPTKQAQSVALDARHNVVASASSLQTSRHGVAGDTILSSGFLAWLSFRSTTKPTLTPLQKPRLGQLGLAVSQSFLHSLGNGTSGGGCRYSVSHWCHPASRHCEDDPHRENCCGVRRCVCAAWIHTDWTVLLLRGGVRRPERGIAGSCGAILRAVTEKWTEQERSAGLVRKE